MTRFRGRFSVDGVDLGEGEAAIEPGPIAESVTPIAFVAQETIPLTIPEIVVNAEALAEFTGRIGDVLFAYVKVIAPAIASLGLDRAVRRLQRDPRLRRLPRSKRRGLGILGKHGRRLTARDRRAASRQEIQRWRSASVREVRLAELTISHLLSAQAEET